MKTPSRDALGARDEMGTLAPSSTLRGGSPASTKACSKVKLQLRRNATRSSRQTSRISPRPSASSPFPVDSVAWHVSPEVGSGGLASGLRIARWCDLDDRARLRVARAECGEFRGGSSIRKTVTSRRREAAAQVAVKRAHHLRALDQPRMSLGFSSTTKISSFATPHRHRERKGRARTDLALDPDLAPVQFDELA
jgi:hypothetical protein